MNYPSMRKLGLALAGLLGLYGAAIADNGIANGPFTYSPNDAGSTTFQGPSSPAVLPSYSFTITAPSGTSFPAPGRNGSPTAEPVVKVFTITKIADADGDSLLDGEGNPLPVEIPGGSALYTQIASSFGISTPDGTVFLPGGSKSYLVNVANPAVADADLGDYKVTIKAQDPGVGIGVGSGTTYTIKLRPASLLDTIAPTVNIVSPANNSCLILGLLSFEFNAEDPAGGTGIASMSATLQSMSLVNQVLTLSLSASLPVPALQLVTATSTYSPVGGPAGDARGTTLAMAFDALNRSGVGNYTLSASATDGAGNVGLATSSFSVKYAVDFTTLDANVNSGQPGKSFVRVNFTMKRSSSTSDGAFMFDKTVRVEIIDSSNNVVGTHLYGTGSIKTVTQINAVGASFEYQTQFVREDLLGVSGLGTYKIRVSVKDVDGNWMIQSESTPVSF